MNTKIKTTKGYVYNKFIFLIYLTVLFILFMVAAYSLGFDYGYKIFFNCTSQECTNPLFGLKHEKYNQGEDNTWMNQRYLKKGTYGIKQTPNFIFNNFALIAVLLGVLSFVANHFLYNKGKIPHIEFAGGYQHEIDKDKASK